MPIIADLLKHSVFYLFDTEQSAREGVNAGGTGFFVSLRTQTGHDFEYAVTNKHVIEGGDTVIRLNKSNKEAELENIPIVGLATISTKPEDWAFHPGGADVAATLIRPNPKDYFFLPISSAWMARSEMIGNALAGTAYIDVGDDVYMLGRFVHRGGKASNIPSARSGMISALPDIHELIPLANQAPQEAFLVEMRSLPGCSGSPTFLHNDLSDFQVKFEAVAEKVYGIAKPAGSQGPDQPFLLLGIDAGSFSIFEKIYIKDKTAHYEHPEFVSKNPSGFSVVIPAWKILETLDNENLLIERDRRISSDKP